MKRSLQLIGLFSLMATMLWACHPKQKQQETASSPIPAEMDSINFPLPDIPSMVNTPEERKAFLLTHFWDRYAFQDTASATEGCIYYTTMLANEESDALRKASLDAFCAKLSTDEKTCDEFLDVMKELLFDSNSPQYNETLYAEFLQSMSRKLSKNDVRQSIFDYRLELINRNKPGNKASDFTYSLKDGNQNTLLHTPVKGDKLILLFYDPECGHCNEVTNRMKADKNLQRAIEEGQLTLLAIYTEGDDEIWKKSLSDLPQEWTAATDHEYIKTHSLFDLKAMPTLYLLDSNKRVILKDAPYERICEYLGWAE